LSDDLATDPEGLSFNDLMTVSGQEQWEDICHELKKMPLGKRSLRKAIAITDKEGYKRES
jgi:hypothetical protein